MALAAQRILIIGGGFAGMSAAIRLSAIGAEVDLVEIDKDWRTDGAGISVSGPSLRAIKAVGVLPEFREQGGEMQGLDMFTSEGHKITQLPTPPVPGTDITGGGGIMRPVLAKILADKTRAADVNVKLGVTFTAINQTDAGATVTFDDGTEATYELVVGADGMFSSVRKAVFPEAPEPQYTGQGVWRAVVPRFGMETGGQFMGRRGKVGFTPVSADEMYLYYTEARPSRDRVPEEDMLPHLKGLLEEFSAPVVVKVRDSLGPASQILLRPLEGLLLPRPWFKGRALLIGDAVHATTPHLASGAGMGHEDAVVLAEEMERGGALDEVLERYQNRRWERCRMVVTNSLRLGEIEMAGGPWEEHAQIMALSMSALMAPP